MTTYKYFVSYAHSGPKGSGFGSLIVDRRAPLESGEAVRGLENDILKAVGPDTKTVTILNFQLLSTTEEPQL